jgi:mannose-6-phosphate isomerase-like protein (cupin superfamily)
VRAGPFEEDVMTAVILDAAGGDDAPAWWFLDTLVVEHRWPAPNGAVVLEMTLPPGSAPPVHVHAELDDTWFVVEGTMALRCGDHDAVVGAGDWVSMPRGVPHGFRVLGDHPARILLVHDNTSFRDLVRDLGTPATARSLPDPPSFPAPDELAGIAASHDLTPVGPPMSPDAADEIAAATARR